MIGPKRPRLRLDPEAYDRLCQEILERDGWRCQSCGTMRGLEVHHQCWRSALGDDAQQNLITLCHRCHWQIHRHEDIGWPDEPTE